MSRTIIKSKQYIVCDGQDRVVGDWNFIVCRDATKAIALVGNYNDIEGSVYELRGCYNKCTGPIWYQEGHHNEAGVEKISPRCILDTRTAPLRLPAKPAAHRGRTLLSTAPPIIKPKRRFDSLPSVAAAEGGVPVPVPRVKRRLTFADLPGPSAPAAVDSAPATQE
jgi:hypothetical protein